MSEDSNPSFRTDTPLPTQHSTAAEDKKPKSVEELVIGTFAETLPPRTRPWKRVLAILGIVLIVGIALLAWRRAGNVIDKVPIEFSDKVLSLAAATPSVDQSLMAGEAYTVSLDFNEPITSCTIGGTGVS